MNSKLDKESRSCDDIVFLSETITHSMDWQDEMHEIGTSYN
jgi:hypothetical protein